MVDGNVRKIISDKDIQPGYIVRHLNMDGTSDSFADAMIVSKSTGHQSEILNVKLARPYLFSHLSETCCAGFLAGVEEYTVSYQRLVETHVIVVGETGKPHCMKV
jgi:hypothetical protein